MTSHQSRVLLDVVLLAAGISLWLGSSLPVFNMTGWCFVLRPLGVLVTVFAVALLFGAVRWWLGFLVLLIELLAIYGIIVGW